MKPHFKIAAFYTIDTPYEDEIKNVMEDCKRLGLQWFIQGFHSKGKWELNCAMKSRFLFEALQRSDCDLMYVDADARIRRYPDLMESFKEDIGVHYHNNQEVLSGTILLKNNSNCKEILRRWIIEQDRTPSKWDQRVLQHVLNSMESEVKILRLPGEYTKIFDTMAGVKNPVVEHFQKSRQYRRKVNKG